MNNRLRTTLAAIFDEPTRSDISWRRIEALIHALGGAVSDGHGSRRRFHLNGRVATFHRPHPGDDTRKATVEGIRRFLRNAGAVPDQEINGGSQ
ncbi:type II toxin-antitoxin system HicA family toxin [bacterium]|nr:type II toxin-antitoxin system HicA family toxin [bacterium]